MSYVNNLKFPEYVFAILFHKRGKTILVSKNSIK